MSGGGFTAGTNLIVWRETPSPGQVFSCSNPQGPGLPLPNGTLVVFDEQERAEQPAPCVVTCNPFTPTFFPAATNRIRIGATGLPTSSSFGWLMVDFKDQPTAKAQAWMGTVMSASGKFSVGLAAQALDSGCQPKCLTNTGQGLALHPCNGGGQ